jgi:serine/threonine protein kinase
VIRVREALREIATQPSLRWADLLAKQFPHDPVLVQQALLWLHAGDEITDDDAPPSLGDAGEERYQLTMRLDAGATATVWQANDRKLGRTVAIKVFRASEEDGLHQVMAEARAACDVISDHVVRVFDVHEDAPRPYIVMELIGEHDPERGELALGTAASVCAPRDFEEAARWVMQVARGVHDAHLRNVFHRDLKPHNVLITPISRAARIADFGLAVAAIDAGTMALTKRGSLGPVRVAGTPDFMAPEQARGLPLDLDPRAAEQRHTLVAIDVWGLGALAYALLAGRAPWQRTDGTESWELAASGAKPPPLERRIPRRLRRIVEKATALDPDARYASAGQVANELAAYLARRPTTHDRSRLSRLGLWTRRNPRLTAAGIVALALIAMMVVSRGRLERIRAERDALNTEVAATELQLAELSRHIVDTRRDLEQTESKLRSARDNLVAVTRSLEDERRTYETLLRDKDQALTAANTATRQVVDQLDQLRRRLRELERAEAQLAATKQEAERVLKERDKARRERDIVRDERDGLRDERDAAITDRERIQNELDKLRRRLGV